MASKKVKLPKENNWDKVAVGTWFSCEIYGNLVVGQIQKQNDEIYLCQNEEEGTGCIDKLGFSYSWNIGRGSIHDIIIESVTKLELLKTQPKDMPPPSMKVGDYVVRFRKGNIRFGCTEISNELAREIVSKLID